MPSHTCFRRPSRPGGFGWARRPESSNIDQGPRCGVVNTDPLTSELLLGPPETAPGATQFPNPDS